MSIKPGDFVKFRGLLRKPELYVRPNVCSTCRLRPLWKSAVFRAGNVVSDVGCHIFPLKLQIAEPGTRSCAFSHWDSGAQWGQNKFEIAFLYSFLKPSVCKNANMVPWTKLVNQKLIQHISLHVAINIF